MTDNEIIKAWECCNGFASCPDDCPYNSEEFKKKANCIDKKEGIMAKTLDLINRQQAEIERLTSAIEVQHESCLVAMEVCKTEAYKEFAERLKAYFNNGRDVMYLQTFIHYGIDRFVKELTEVSENA